MQAATQIEPRFQPCLVPRLEPVPAAGEQASAHYEELLLQNLEFIERTVGTLARRNALKPWDADDLEGLVKLRLVADDYAVLRKFEGRSKLTTFLTTVIHNQFRDFRIQRWGKWRPSAAAKRLGDLGIQLETLLYRDGFTTDEAIEIVRGRLAVETSEEEFRSVAASLRPRTNRRFEDDSLLARLAASDQTDQGLIEGERLAARERAVNALGRVLRSLDPEDRLILKLRFADSLTIRAIAESLDLPQRRMYSRLQKLLVAIRQGIEKLGVSCEEVMDLVDQQA